MLVDVIASCARATVDVEGYAGSQTVGWLERKIPPICTCKGNAEGEIRRTDCQAKGETIYCTKVLCCIPSQRWVSVK